MPIHVSPFSLPQPLDWFSQIETGQPYQLHIWFPPLLEELEEDDEELPVAPSNKQ